MDGLYTVDWGQFAEDDGLIGVDGGDCILEELVTQIGLCILHCNLPLLCTAKLIDYQFQS